MRDKKNAFTQILPSANFIFKVFILKVHNGMKSTSVSMNHRVQELMRQHAVLHLVVSSNISSSSFSDYPPKRPTSSQDSVQFRFPILFYSYVQSTIRTQRRNMNLNMTAKALDFRVFFFLELGFRASFPLMPCVMVSTRGSKDD